MRSSKMENKTIAVKEQPSEISQEQFRKLLKANKKKAVRQLATKIANSPDLRDVWINSQVDGEQPLIKWEDDRLENVARDYFAWPRK